MQAIPYLNFNGQCKEAFEFYAKCLGGKIESMFTFGDSPMANDVPPEQHGTIMHARLVAGDALLMGSDRPPNQPEETKGIYVSLMIPDPAEGKRIFDALSENGKVEMPFTKTFWADGFGSLVDRFGTPWMINSEGQAGSGQ